MESQNNPQFENPIYSSKEYLMSIYEKDLKSDEFMNMQIAEYMANYYSSYLNNNYKYTDDFNNEHNYYLKKILLFPGIIPIIDESGGNSVKVIVESGVVYYLKKGLTQKLMSSNSKEQLKITELLITNKELQKYLTPNIKNLNILKTTKYVYYSIVNYYYNLTYTENYYNNYDYELELIERNNLLTIGETDKSTKKKKYYIPLMQKINEIKTLFGKVFTQNIHPFEVLYLLKDLNVLNEFLYFIKCDIKHVDNLISDLRLYKINNENMKLIRFTKQYNSSKNNVCKYLRLIYNTTDYNVIEKEYQNYIDKVKEYLDKIPRSCPHYKLLKYNLPNKTLINNLTEYISFDEINDDNWIKCKKCGGNLMCPHYYYYALNFDLPYYGILKKLNKFIESDGSTYYCKVCKGIIISIDFEDADNGIRDSEFDELVYNQISIVMGYVKIHKKFNKFDFKGMIFNLLINRVFNYYNNLLIGNTNIEIIKKQIRLFIIVATVRILFNSSDITKATFNSAKTQEEYVNELVVFLYKTKYNLCDKLGMKTIDVIRKNITGLFNDSVLMSMQLSFEMSDIYYMNEIRYKMDKLVMYNIYLNITNQKLLKLSEFEFQEIPENKVNVNTGLKSYELISAIKYYEFFNNDNKYSSYFIQETVKYNNTTTVIRELYKELKIHPSLNIGCSLIYDLNGNKHSFNDGKCSTCGKTKDELYTIKYTDKEVDSIISNIIYNEYVTNFYKYYKIECPKGQNHTFKNNVCTKCNISKEDFNINNPDKFDKYMETYFDDISFKDDNVVIKKDPKDIKETQEQKEQKIDFNETYNQYVGTIYNTFGLNTIIPSLVFLHNIGMSTNRHFSKLFVEQIPVTEEDIARIDIVYSYCVLFQSIFNKSPLTTKYGRLSGVFDEYNKLKKSIQVEEDYSINEDPIYVKASNCILRIFYKLIISTMEKIDPKDIGELKIIVKQLFTSIRRLEELTSKPSIILNALEEEQEYIEANEDDDSVTIGYEDVDTAGYDSRDNVEKDF